MQSLLFYNLQYTESHLKFGSHYSTNDLGTYDQGSIRIRVGQNCSIRMFYGSIHLTVIYQRLCGRTAIATGFLTVKLSIGP